MKNRKIFGRVFIISFFPFLVFALPNDSTVVNGSVKISSNKVKTQIVQASEKAIINWQNFSIDKGETVEFQVPSLNSSTLNRVTGSNASEIHGVLKSNGTVFLINPRGILIGKEGRIEVGSLIASTYDLNDQQYLTGSQIEFKEKLSSKISNLGVVEVLGDIVFIAKEIENKGTLKAPNGKASLNAGYELYLFLQDQMKTVVRLKKGGSAKTSGVIEAAQAEIQAAGGSAYALAVEARGIIDASGTAVKNGRVILVSEGVTEVNGKIFSENKNKTGGEIYLLGDTVKLQALADINSSGEKGGGLVLVGGDYLGGNNGAANASFVYMDRKASIEADSLENGRGGKVVLWSDKGTDWRGKISVKGGINGGDGGFIEVSSKGYLTAIGRSDAFAKKGRAGELCLDPSDIIISSASSSPSLGFSECNPIGASCILNLEDLKAALALQNVTVRTSAGKGGEGNITISGPLVYSSIYKLTLQADKNLVIAADVVNNGVGELDFYIHQNNGDSLFKIESGKKLFSQGPITINGSDSSSGTETYQLNHVADNMRIIGGLAGKTALSFLENDTASFLTTKICFCSNKKACGRTVFGAGGYTVEHAYINYLYAPREHRNVLIAPANYSFFLSFSYPENPKFNKVGIDAQRDDFQFVNYYDLKVP